MPLTLKPATNLTGVITVPGDKSLSHRAVMFASLAKEKSRISDWLPAGDCWATVEAMRALGAQIDILSQDETGAELVIHGVGLQGLKSPDKPINCRGSGTTMRLLAGIVAGLPLDVTLTGHEGLCRRPMQRVARPLRLMGADVQTRDGRPPMRIRGGRLFGIDYEMPIASGQIKSAILLAGLFAEGETVVRQPGPARDHTERLLQAQGVSLASIGKGAIRLSPPQQPLRPLTLAIPGDFSSAAFPLIAALLVPNSHLKIESINVNSTRTGLLDVLQKMGAKITLSNPREAAGEPLADLEVQSSALRGVEVQGDTVVRMIDEFPIFAVAATQAQERTIVRDAAELRVKETDRIKATVNELRKMGAHLIPHPDGFEVHGPTPLKGAVVDSDGDHRLAMALSVAGLIAKGKTTVKNAGVIGDSYPGFTTMLKEIGAEVSE